MPAVLGVVSVTGADIDTVAVVSLPVVFTLSVCLQPTVARRRSEAHKLMIVFIGILFVLSLRARWARRVATARSACWRCIPLRQLAYQPEYRRVTCPRRPLGLVGAAGHVSCADERARRARHRLNNQEPRSWPVTALASMNGTNHQPRPNESRIRMTKGMGR